MNIVESQGRYTFYNRVNILDKLPVGNYFLDFDKFGCFIRAGEEFNFPKKLYDVEKPLREIILKSYHASPSSTGVLLEGYKGTGKTMTSKLLCKEANLPVIIIDKKIPLEHDFAALIQSIQQDIVVFIDEFEKLFNVAHYDNDDSKNHNQDSFLGLMDGVSNNTYKRLWLLTSNDEIGDKFINRPSRIRFYKKYSYMNEGLYHMILDDLLKNKTYKKDLTEQLSVSEATIDLLTSIIREINVLNMPYSSFRDIFNHKPRYMEYELSVLKDKAFVELGTVDISHVPDHNTSYLAGVHVSKVINANKEEFIFESPHAHNLYNLKFKKEDREKPGVHYVYKFYRKALPFKEFAS